MIEGSICCSSVERFGLVVGINHPTRTDSFPIHVLFVKVVPVSDKWIGFEGITFTTHSGIILFAKTFFHLTAEFLKFVLMG